MSFLTTSRTEQPETMKIASTVSEDTEVREMAPEAPTIPVSPLPGPHDRLPWEGGLPVAARTSDDLRVHLIHSLSEERASLSHRPDVAFIDTLCRTFSSPTLQLPAFPASAREIATLIAAGASAHELVKVVETDPGMVQRVWQSASRAEFRSPPKGVHHAIARIGFVELWRISMKQCVDGLVLDVAGFATAAETVRRQGRVSAEMVAMLGGDKRGPGYVAGLMHDIGKLVIYRAANNDVRRDTVMHIAEAHHAALGALVAHIWQLGDPVADAIRCHHDPDPRDLARHVAIAEIAAWGAEDDLMRHFAAHAIANLKPEIDTITLLDLAGLLASGRALMSDTAVTPRPQPRSVNPGAAHLRVATTLSRADAR